jgi:hypothetical protein
MQGSLYNPCATFFRLLQFPKNFREPYLPLQLYTFLNSALEEGGWSALRPGRFTPEKTRYPLYRRLVGTQGRSGRVRKISPPPGFDSRTVQPIASRYADWAIPAPASRYKCKTKRQRTSRCNRYSNVYTIITLRPEYCVTNCNCFLKYASNYIQYYTQHLSLQTKRVLIYRPEFVM